jgi:hypothetical protein
MIAMTYTQMTELAHSFGYLPKSETVTPKRIESFWQRGTRVLRLTSYPDPFTRDPTTNWCLYLAAHVKAMGHERSHLTHVLRNY